jgi:hypothetical protein
VANREEPLDFKQQTHALIPATSRLMLVQWLLASDGPLCMLCIGFPG